MREFNVLSSRRQRHFWPKLLRRLLTSLWILFCIVVGLTVGLLLSQELH